nr:hypothetical protein [uncultured bacterium]
MRRLAEVRRRCVVGRGTAVEAVFAYVACGATTSAAINESTAVAPLATLFIGPLPKLIELSERPSRVLAAPRSVQLGLVIGPCGDHEPSATSGNPFAAGITTTAMPSA